MARSRGFRPVFTISPKVVKALMRIEACREAVDKLPLSATILDSLRSSARLLSTHYSTQIEGNRLNPQQVRAVLKGGGPFPGRERDEREVRHYHQALEYMESLAAGKAPISERMIQTLHGLVEYGKKKPTPYRDGQNVIRHSRTGAMIYLPPEAKDVPRLMRELVAWVQKELVRQEYPVPVVAALAHYQFATIHPYFDGNGRTARLLTTLILHRGGYGLRGIYSLEEYYAKNLTGYYGALAVGGSHNYYMGRADADCSEFVEYFCLGMLSSFESVRRKAEKSDPALAGDALLLRELDSLQRSVLGLFLRQSAASSAELATYLQLKPRNAALLAKRWVERGFLALADPSKRSRKYRLGDRFEPLVNDA